MLNKLKPKSEFSRNVLTLMTGTTIAQAIPIAISPILTRIYTPEDFGMFALYMSVASILSVVATGRYELAIMLPKKDEDAVNIVALSILISFFVSFMALLTVFIFNAQITNLLGNPEISSWLYFIPITVLWTGIYQSFNYWSNRKKQYKRLAMSRVIQSGTTATTNLGMGFGGFGGSGLILGAVLGQGVATAILAKMVWGEDKDRIYVLKKLKILALARKYKKFPTWNLFSSFISTLRLNILVFFFSKFFLSSFLGFYYMADRMLRLPISLFIGAFSDVFFQKISKLKSYTDIFDTSKAYFFKLFFLLTVPYIIVIFFLKDTVPFIFGEEWRELYLYMYVLSLPIFFNLLTTHFSKVLIVINRQEVSFYFHLYKLLFLLIVLFSLTIYNLFDMLALVILSINEIVWMLIGVILIKNILKVKEFFSHLYLLSFLLIGMEIIIYLKVLK
jgi:O-antigen/teichoic acid export membrane protein